MLLVFFFLALTGICFSLVVSEQHDTLDEGKTVSYGCNGNIYWQQTRICSSKGKYICQRSAWILPSLPRIVIYS